MAFDIHCHFGTSIGAQTDGAVVIFYSSLQVYSFLICIAFSALTLCCYYLDRLTQM